MKELWSLLGKVNFMRKFIPTCVEFLALLVGLTKKDDMHDVVKRWGLQHDNEVFTRVKQLLIEAPISQWITKELVIHVDNV